MAPIVHGLEAQYSGQVNFVYLDIDDRKNDDFKKALGYRVQPHFLLLDGEGNVVQQWLGRVKGEDLEAAIKTVISN
jgi:thioredoxin-like negative regulator of GroEL